MASKRIKKIKLNSARDLPILFFLWKWKVSTTKAIAARFFSDCDPRNCYVRLAELARAGLIQSRADSTGHKHVWLLDKGGFEIILPALPHLKEEGFGSEHIGHDLLCSAVLLGEFLQEQPDEIELFTEQELRRYSENEFPKEIPKRALRRPDGFWYVSKENAVRVIALEVELTPKGESDYNSIGYFYNQATSIDQVVWVVRTSGLISKILNSFSRSELEQRKIHSFFLASDFLKSGWNARVVAGKNIQSTLLEILSISPVIFPVSPVVSQRVPRRCTSGASGHYKKLLALSRTHKDSNSYAQYTFGDFP